MIIITALAAIGYFLFQNYQYYGDGDMTKISGQKSFLQLDPSESVHDDVERESFVGQPYSSVRLPFGNNPYFHKINDWDLLHNKNYYDSYQKNIHNVYIDTPTNWKLDETYNSEINNYSNPHMQENFPPLIKSYWENNNNNNNILYNY